jgi:hypothetical protein
MAVMLLLFGRSIQGTKPVIPLKGATEDLIIHICKKLMLLQDLRNPAAHRQTMVKFMALDQARNEVFGLLSSIQKIV